MLRIESLENNPRVLRYRVVDETGAALQQADITAITLYVYDITATATQKAAESLTVSACVYDTLQPWDYDAVGYNLRVPISGSYLPDAGKTYRVEILITPATGEGYLLDPVEILTIETYGVA